MFAFFQPHRRKYSLLVANTQFGGQKRNVYQFQVSDCSVKLILLNVQRLCRKDGIHSLKIGITTFCEVTKNTVFRSYVSRKMGEKVAHNIE